MPRTRKRCECKNERHQWDKSQMVPAIAAVKAKEASVKGAARRPEKNGIFTCPEKTCRTEQRPVLLILDGHSSHVRNSGVIDLARENHVTIISLPPYSTHMLQPLDRTFFLQGSVDQVA
ncbi:hypothetical protein AVEN_113634-1 [Araneus ventricosus]|uniref:DDE-1 domain-containing protein n=1 Tax=Araneus ventricosus TaxID=182803 RepID=A0A4Y2NND6_ARAVE|nr:hypothetical protein AVEN_113634-1 [Araneus ventricosus]